MTRALRLNRQDAKFGPLPLISSLLLASALVRMGGDGGQTVVASLATFTKKAQAAADPGGQSDEIATILADLEARETRLDRREAVLENEAGEIDAARADLSAQLDEIAAAEAELQEFLQMASTAAQRDLERLATVYENMKPGDAAALFAEMQPDFAAGFIGLIQPAAAAEILSALPSENAYAISVMLAGRHADIQVE